MVPSFLNLWSGGCSVVCTWSLPVSDDMLMVGAYVAVGAGEDEEVGVSIGGGGIRRLCCRGRRWCPGRYGMLFDVVFSGGCVASLGFVWGCVSGGVGFGLCWSRSLCTSDCMNLLWCVRVGPYVWLCFLRLCAVGGWFVFGSFMLVLWVLATMMWCAWESIFCID